MRRGYCGEHLRERYPAEWAALGVSEVMGKVEPRLFTRPLRPLTRQTSHGYAVADFADMLGEPLQPWEKWVAIHALELSPDGTYRFRVVLVLVARQNGKSHLKRIISLWRMYMYSRTRILGVAQDVSLAREQMDFCKEIIRDCPDLAAEWEVDSRKAGDEWFRASGSKYGVKAANRKAGRGGSNDEVNIDELREQRDWNAWAALSKTTLARPNSQIWAMSNQGDAEAVVLHALRKSMLAGTQPDHAIFEYSAPDGCELDDVEAIAQANPSLGHRISLAGILSALATDPPAVYRAECLCQEVDSLDGAVDLAAWRACADPSGTMRALKGRVAACFDISPDGDHCTLIAGGKLDDGRIRVEIVKSWKSTEQARAELPGILEKLRPVALGWFPVGPAAAFGPLLRKQRNVTALNGTQVAEACQGLSDLVNAKRIVHPSDPLLDAHIAASTKLPSGDGWRFTRRGANGHVDAAYACAGVVWIVEAAMPAQKGPGIRVLSA